MPKLISIVVPVYNEANNIVPFLTRIHEVFSCLDYDFKIIFCNDGSEDDTLYQIRRLAEVDECVDFISFSRNFGQQKAIRAGMEHATGDCVICMDGDLQHPPELIPQMIDKWEQGYDVVYTIRKENKEIGFLKNLTSKMFYKIMNYMSDLNLNYGEADFRLLSSRVAELINSFPEKNLYYRAIVKWVGFRQVGIEYFPDIRRSGKSKYNYRTMTILAIEGITSFSIKPLTFATYLGLLISTLSLLYIPYIVFSLYNNHPISGWASVIFSVALFGGLILFMLGIIGVYLGKMYMQQKGRPTYIVEETSLVWKKQLY